MFRYFAQPCKLHICLLSAMHVLTFRLRRNRDGIWRAVCYRKFQFVFLVWTKVISLELCQLVLQIFIAFEFNLAHSDLLEAKAKRRSLRVEPNAN